MGRQRERTKGGLWQVGAKGQSAGWVREKVHNGKGWEGSRRAWEGARLEWTCAPLTSKGLQQIHDTTMMPTSWPTISTSWARALREEPRPGEPPGAADAEATDEADEAEAERGPRPPQ